MQLYKRFALLSVVSTYALIFIGGLVRVSGAGLGCPDWPKCFGRWVPPFNVHQLPAEFDPNMFNFVLAWIEYINRVIGVLVGFFILITAILALVYFRKNMRILIPSLLAAILVAYQGWQGSQVVASELEPIVVSAHMVIAFVIISLLIYATLQSFYHSAALLQKGAEYPWYSAKLVFGLWGAAILQVLLGTQVRGAIEHTIRDYPLLYGSELIAKVGAVDSIHKILGILTVLATWAIVWILFKKSRGLSSAVKYSGISLLVIAFIQITIGHLLIALNLNELVQILHLWMASLYIGNILILQIVLNKERNVLHVS